MPTKRATATPKEAKSDTSGDGRLSSLERIEALEARTARIEEALALGAFASKTIFRND